MLIFKKIIADGLSPFPKSTVGVFSFAFLRFG